MPDPPTTHRPRHEGQPWTCPAVAIVGKRHSLACQGARRRGRGRRRQRHRRGGGPGSRRSRRLEAGRRGRCGGPRQPPKPPSMRPSRPSVGWDANAGVLRDKVVWKMTDEPRPRHPGAPQGHLHRSVPRSCDEGAGRGRPVIPRLPAGQTATSVDQPCRCRHRQSGRGTLRDKIGQRRRPGQPGDDARCPSSSPTSTRWWPASPSSPVANWPSAPRGRRRTGRHLPPTPPRRSTRHRRRPPSLYSHPDHWCEYAAGGWSVAIAAAWPELHPGPSRSATCRLPGHPATRHTKGLDEHRGRPGFYHGGRPRAHGPPQSASTGRRSASRPAARAPDDDDRRPTASAGSRP